MRAYLVTGCMAAMAASIAGVGCGSDDDAGGSTIASGGGSNTGSGGSSGGDGTGGSGFGARPNRDGGAGGELPDGACGLETAEATVQQANVLLVIDQSGSMMETLGSGNRWDAMESALTTALNETKDSLDFGLDLFPSAGCDVPSDPALAVPVEDGATGVPKILTALAATGPVDQGGTPTANALARAYAYFKDGPGADLTGSKYVLLATDGGPNCNTGHAPCGANSCTVNMEMRCPVANCCDGLVESCLDDVATIAEVEKLAAEGVHTFVVGIPGSDAFVTTLNAMATAGGEPRSGDVKYYAVTSAAELTATFRSITRNLVKSCELQLTESPEDPDNVIVEVDGEKVERGADGWRLDLATTPPTIVLLGQTCQDVEQRGAESVRIVLGCGEPR